MKCDNHDGNDGNDSNHSNKRLNSKGSAPPPTHSHRSKYVICITDIIGNNTLPNCNLISSQRTSAEPAILSQALSSQKCNVVNLAFIPANPLHSIKNQMTIIINRKQIKYKCLTWLFNHFFKKNKYWTQRKAHKVYFKILKKYKSFHSKCSIFSTSGEGGFNEEIPTGRVIGHLNHNNVFLLHE